MNNCFYCKKCQKFRDPLTWRVNRKGQHECWYCKMRASNKFSEDEIEAIGTFFLGVGARIEKSAEKLKKQIN